MAATSITGLRRRVWSGERTPRFLPPCSGARQWKTIPSWSLIGTLERNRDCWRYGDEIEFDELVCILGDVLTEGWERVAR